MLIEFKNMKDFRNRFPSLFLNQKEGESYDFIFPDQETQNEFNMLVNAFNNPKKVE